MTFNRPENSQSSREQSSTVTWPSTKEPAQLKVVYEDDRPLPALAKAAALADKQLPPPRKVPEQPKIAAKP
jgi:hypothetical protein